MSKNILVIGSANMDLTIHTDRMPKLGETVVGHDFSLNSGGKGANQAVAVAKLGGNIKFLGAVGNDAYGKKLLKDFEKYGVIFEGIKSTDVSTGTASITVVGSDNFIILNAGANDLMTPKLIEENADLIKAADYLIMQLEIPVETVLRAAQIAKNAGTKVVLNPAPYKDLPEEIYKFIDIIIPNEHEAQLATGIEVTDNESTESAINALKQKGIETVIITLGAKGCAYNTDDKIHFQPAEKSKAVDTTSAGDSFIGALCCRLALEDSLPDAVKYATKVAAITVSRYGASDSIPFAHEVK